MLAVILLVLLALAVVGAWFALACVRAEARSAGEPDPVPEHLARTAWQRTVRGVEALASHVPVPARHHPHHAHRAERGERAGRTDQGPGSHQRGHGERGDRDEVVQHADARGR